jgi:hypothetical protein
VGCASALYLCPGAKVSGYQTDLLTPWYDGRAKIIPVRYLPMLLGGKGMSHVGRGTGDLPSQGTKLRVLNPAWARYPHVVAPVAPQCPRHTPSRWYAPKAGAWHHFRRVRELL